MDLSNQDLLTMLIRAEREPAFAEREARRLRELLEACPHCLRVSRIVRSRTSIRIKAPARFATRLRTLLFEQGGAGQTAPTPRQ